MHLALALILLIAAATPLRAQESCRQALAIGLDVSGSVDAREYALQRDGLAAALLDPDVVAALLAIPGTPVRLAVFEWSGPGDQVVTLPWVAIDSRETLDRSAGQIASTGRSLASRETAIGAALLAGGGLLRGQGDCPKRTLDLSGDGKSNAGPRPRDVGSPALDGVTVNALVIGEAREDRVAELSAYFGAEVIRGPGAFVEVALGFEDYEAAMVRKLLKELEGLNVARLAPAQ